MCIAMCILGAALLVGVVMFLLRPRPPKSTVTDADVARWARSGSASVVMFFAPWCGWSKKVLPLFQQAGKKSKSVQFQVAVDANVPKSLKKYKVRAFPTIVKLRAGKVETFSGARTVAGFLKFAAAN